MISRYAAAGVVAVLLATGCSAEDSPSAGSVPSASVVVSSAPPPAPAPQVGSCHRLSHAAATTPVDDGEAAGVAVDDVAGGGRRAMRGKGEAGEGKVDYEGKYER